MNKIIKKLSILFQNNNKKPEPIYAEPTKTAHQRNKSSVSCNAAIGGGGGTATGDYQPLNIFQQNREKWQKIAIGEGSSNDTKKAAAATQQQSNILTSRNRLQPDLVMDLPLTQDNTTPPLSSGSASASSSLQSLDKLQSQENEDPESMTLGEHFAKQNQCTLKKNEKFADSSPNSKKPIAEVKPQDSTTDTKESSGDEVVLRIEESTDVSAVERMSTGSTDSQSSTASSTALKIDLEKSPIPARNTQKFISQFADLKLTGGCSTIAKTSTTASATTSKAEKTEKERSSFISSFKPQLKVKPQVLLKKPSLFLHGHSAPSTSSSNSNNQQQ